MDAETVDQAGRTAFARRAVAALPHMLLLLDRNPHSPTFGCFDRNYWQYRRHDFPVGMAQEMVWPLAIAWSENLPGDTGRFRYAGSPALKEWLDGALAFTARSAHRSGACDDFYPYETAVGASAFSLLAALGAATILGYRTDEFSAFVARRAAFLANRRESGQLANHEALVVRCLLAADSYLGGARFRDDAEARLGRLLTWRHPEGWFYEYAGCDLGYQTLTLALLAEIRETLPDPALDRALIAGADLCLAFQHPDGSFGGEIMSRNTYNFFAHGFEAIGRFHPPALVLNDRYAAALDWGLTPCFTDDHMLAHHAWSDLLTWQRWVAERPADAPALPARIHLRGAGLIAERRGDWSLYCATVKGGVFRLYHGTQLIAADTQVSLKTRVGVAVAHLYESYETAIDDDAIVVAGRLGYAKSKLMTPLRMILLRFVMLTVGRLFPDAVRHLLQKAAIVGKRAAPFTFRRRIGFSGNAVEIEDRIDADRGWRSVESAVIAGHQTSIMVVQSRPFVPDHLKLETLDLTPKLTGLKDDAPLTLTRRFAPPARLADSGRETADREVRE